MIVNNEILSALQKVAVNKDPVKLVNEYKGLPIIHPVKLLEITSEGVLVEAHPQQAVCLSLEEFTFIQSEKLPFVLRASVDSVNIHTCTARLTNILYGPDTIGGRSQIRVQPAFPVNVTISGRSRVLHGELADVSLVGVGVYALSAYMYNPVTLKRGTTVQVRVVLLGEEEVIIPGVILYATREGDTYRLGVSTEPDEATRSKLSAFISIRGGEIEAELGEIYNQMVNAG